MEPTSEERAIHIRDLLTAHYTDNQRESAIDLLVDLMHWHTAEGYEFDRTLWIARNHYNAEHLDIPARQAKDARLNTTREGTKMDPSNAESKR